MKNQGQKSDLIKIHVDDIEKKNIIKLESDDSESVTGNPNLHSKQSGSSFDQKSQQPSIMNVNVKKVQLSPKQKKILPHQPKSTPNTSAKNKNCKSTINKNVNDATQNKNGLMVPCAMKKASSIGNLRPSSNQNARLNSAQNKKTSLPKPSISNLNTLSNKNQPKTKSTTNINQFKGPETNGTIIEKTEPNTPKITETPFIKTTEDVDKTNLAPSEPQPPPIPKARSNNATQLNNAQTILNSPVMSSISIEKLGSASVLKPPLSAVSSIMSVKSFILQNNITEKSVHVGEPKEPIVFQLFEGYPQPFEQQLPKSAVENKKTVKPKILSKNYPVKSKTLKSSKSKNEINKNNKPKNNSKKKAIGFKDDANFVDEKENKEIDYELDDFELDNASSMSSSSDLDQFDKSDGDLFNKSVITTIDLSELPEKKNRRVNESSNTKLSIDFVKAFEDKLFAIYRKFDNLLSIQENNISNNEKDDQAQEIINQLNEQKVRDLIFQFF
jgi:hypothetical protein